MDNFLLEHLKDYINSILIYKCDAIHNHDDLYHKKNLVYTKEEVDKIIDELYKNISKDFFNSIDIEKNRIDEIISNSRKKINKDLFELKNKREHKALSEDIKINKTNLESNNFELDNLKKEISLLYSEINNLKEEINNINSLKKDFYKDISNYISREEFNNVISILESKV